MRENYILMLNKYQKPLINESLYKKNLKVAFSNSNVTIYETKRLKTKNTNLKK